ncbi:chlorite dismutase [Corynebacterium pseudotuberculosis]|nr:chlorite dismutase [Corynebacterium pseudotuberculosis]
MSKTTNHTVAMRSRWQLRTGRKGYAVAKKINFDELNSLQRYSQFATFKAIPGALGTDRSDIVAQAQEFFAELEREGVVSVRGIYDLSGCRAEADFMIWWIAEEFEQIQDAYCRFRRDTVLGQTTEVFWLGNSLHRPAEFNRSHLPSFIMGEEPGQWITVYPFVRSYDWYLMDPQERRAILVEHGQAAREYPDVRANTVPAFALGDYEWMLAFEAPSLDRIVDLMHQMRYTKARLHVREEVPFFTGKRVLSIGDVISVLP